MEDPRPLNGYVYQETRRPTTYKRARIWSDAVITGLPSAAPIEAHTPMIQRGLYGVKMALVAGDVSQCVPQGGVRQIRQRWRVPRPASDSNPERSSTPVRL